MGGKQRAKKSRTGLTWTRQMTQVGLVVSMFDVLYTKQAEPALPQVAFKSPRPRKPMFRKSILVVALLALAITQALAVNCDLRCSLTGESSGNRSCGQDASIALQHEHAGHCHGMSMQAGNEAPAVLIGQGCGATICKIGLVAITNGTAADDSLISASFLTNPAFLMLPASAGSSFRFRAFGRPHRQAWNTPLDVCPGSPLRI